MENLLELEAEGMYVVVCGFGKVGEDISEWYLGGLGM